MSIAVERFWPKVEKTDNPQDCWLWKAGRMVGGYGGFYVDFKQCYAHAISYEIANGPIPSGLKVVQTCGNILCVNPQHLRLGPKGRGILSGVKLQADGTYHVWLFIQPQYRHPGQYDLGVFPDQASADAAYRQGIHDYL